MGKLTAKLGTSIEGYQEPEQTEPEEAIAAAPATVATRQPAAKAKPVRQAHPLRKPSPGEGRSSNPTYSALKVFVPTADKIAASRKWIDQGGGDMSELVEKLVRDYVRA